MLSWCAVFKLARAARNRSLVQYPPFVSLSASASNILVSRLPEVETPKLPIVEQVFENFGKWGNKIAVVS